MSFIKKQSLHQRKVGDKSFILTADGNIEVQLDKNSSPTKGMNIQGNLIVSGDATGPKVSNVYYVTEDGSDLNDGRSADANGAFATIKKAAEVAPEGSTIIVAPGDYYEENPITLRDYVTVTGQGELRNTRIFPKNNTQTIFYMGNACYLYQLTFRGLRAPGWCVEIRPGTLCTVSPYVQNCTNMNGPWLNDGTEFIPFETVQIEGIEPGARPLMVEDYPSLPLAKQVNDYGGGSGMLVDGDQYDPASLVFSFVADAFTQIAQGGVGFHVTNFGYTQIVSCFTVFCSTGFKTTNGGYLSISNSVSDFGLYGCVADGYYPTAYTNAVTDTNYYSTVGSVTIINPGVGYASAPVVTFDPPTGAGGVTATGTATIDITTGQLSAVTIDNAGSGYESIPAVTFTGGGATIQAEARVNLSTNSSITISSLRDKPQTGSVITFEGDDNFYYITSTNITEPPFIYNETICRRDVRRIVDAVTGDIVLGTNYQSIAAAQSYLRSTASRVILDQLEPTIYALESARDLMKATTSDLAMREQIDQRFNIITTTLAGDQYGAGDSALVPTLEFNDLTTIDPGVVNAKNNILENKDFIIAELTAYINDQFTELSYNQTQFEIDMVNLIKGVAYYVVLGSDLHVIRQAQEFTFRTRFKNMMLSAADFIRGRLLGITEVAASATATSLVNEAFNQFINIIDDGDSSGIIVEFPEHAGVEINRADSKDQIIANKEFIKQEFVSYIAANNATFSFDEDVYKEDIGYVIDALTYDILYGGDSAIIQESKYYIDNKNSFEDLLATERTTLADAFARVRFIIQRIVRGLPVSPSAGNTLSQDYSSGTASQTEATYLDALVQIIETVVSDASISSLEAQTFPLYESEPGALQDAASGILSQSTTIVADVLAYNLNNNPTLTYNTEKCARDVGYLVDAVYRDAQLETNVNSITAANAYKRANTSYLNVEQKPATIIALREAKRLTVLAANREATFATRVSDLFDDILNIIEFDQLPSEGLLYPEPGPASQELINATDQLIANKDFLKAEIIAWINDNNFVYDQDKCSRDTGYILDAAYYDAALGTNYNAVINGLAYQRAYSSKVITDQLTETLDALAYAKGQAQTAAAGDATAQTRVGAAFDEVIDIITNGIVSTETAADPRVFPNPPSATNRINAKDQLQNNRNFLAAEAVAYVQNNYQNFTYDRAKCERDVGLILDAIAVDLVTGSNYNSVIAGLAYLRGNASDVTGDQLLQTVSALRELKKQVKLLGLADDAQSAADNRLDIVINIINGVGYNQNLCERDVGYIVDSVGWDISLGTNYNAIVTGLSYGRAPAEYVKSNQFNQTIAAYEYLKTLTATTYVSGDATAVSRSNAAFDEILDIITGTKYDETICRRDLGYIIDSIRYDILFGTNFNAVSTGLSYQRAPSAYVLSDQFQSTVAAIEYLQGVIANTHLLGETTSISRSNAAFDEILDIINNGTGSADALTWTDPGVDPDKAKARALLQANRSFIATEVTDYITATYPSLTYNVSTCQRDIGYIIDALSFDVQYGGNFATRRAADAYFSFNVSQLPPEQQAASADAMDQLATIAGQVVRELYAGQVTTASPAGAEEQTQVQDLAQIIEDVITANNISSLATLVSPSTSWVSSTIRAALTNVKYYEDDIIDDVITQINSEIISNADALTWTDPGVDANKRYAREQLQTNKNFIANQLTAWLYSTYPNLDYDEKTCQRDVKYIVDALSFDVQYGGNFATRRVADAYFTNAVAILPEWQRTATADAYVQLASIVSQIVTETYPAQDTSGTAASATEATEVSDLVGIIEDVIRANTTSGLPALVEPSTTWVAAGIESARTTFVGAKSTIQTAVISELANINNAPAITYPAPINSTQDAINAKNNLIANKDFIIAEITAWISVYYPALVYDVDKCERDVGYIVDALCHDIMYGGNFASVTNARAYFVGAASQLGAGEATATAAAYNRLGQVVGDVVINAPVVKSTGFAATQDTSGDPASSSEVDELSGLVKIIEDVIIAGNLNSIAPTSLPSVAYADADIQEAYNAIKGNSEQVQENISIWIANNFQSFTYDQAKCERDVAIMIEAVAYDSVFNTNYNSVTAGLAYQRANASVAIGSQNLQTIKAIEYLAERVQALEISSQTKSRANAGFNEILDIINNGVVSTDTSADTLVFTDPVGVDANKRYALNQLQANKAYLKAEITAWIATNYPALVYDVTKCERDVGYIVDALSYDILYGGNLATKNAAESYFVGAVSQLGAGEATATAAAYAELKTILSDVLQNILIGTPNQGVVIQDTGGVGADAGTTGEVQDDLQIIIDVISAGGIGSIPADSAPDITGQSATEQTDYATLIAATTGLQDATIDYINRTFTRDFTFNSTKCERDTKYIVDALTYDILYGGNSASVFAAQSYYYGYLNQIDGETDETAAAIEWVGTLLADVLLADTALKTAQSVATQNTSASAASDIEVTRALELLSLMKNVIRYGTDNLPSTEYPDITWATAGIQSAVADLAAAKDTIVSDTIDYINTTYNGFSYDETQCSRDTGYLIDALAHDLLYTGNIQTLIATRAYFLGAVKYIPESQRTNTVLAYEHIKVVAENCIEGIAVSPTTGNTESQVLSGNYGTGAESAILDGLFDITINAIDNATLVGTPAEVEPDFSWLPASTKTAASVMLAEKVNIQNAVIDYITDNIVGFEYNINKCERDVGYILEATLYDTMYGGNKQTRRAAEAYYNGAILGNARVGNADQTLVSAYSYYYLADLVYQVAINEPVSRSYGNVATQKTTIPDGAESAASYMRLLVDRISQSLIDGYTTGWGEVDHNYDLGSPYYNTERNTILASLDDIEDGSIADLNATYGGSAIINVFPGIVSVTTDQQASLYNVSTISTSGHAFEYVGAGITYNALPFFGGSAVPAQEIVQTTNGKVFAGGTVDQIGNFRVGDFFAVNALTGAIELNANEISLEGLTSVGPFIRNGIPVGVELKEVSDNSNLIASTGVQDSNTSPTQKAVSTYVENRYLNKLTGGTVSGDLTLNGDFDVNGAVISTDTTGEFSLLNTSAETINAFGAANVINIGAASGTMTINPDLLVQGSLTVNGDIVFTGDVSLNIPDESLQAYSISTEGSLDYISINTRTDEERITFGIRPTFLVENTTEATDTSSGAVVIDGGVGIAKSLYVGINFEANGSVVLGDDRAVDTIDINGATDIDLPDNDTSVFRVHENITDYIVVDTTDGSEVVEIGATPNLVVLNNDDATDNVTGAVQVTGGISAQRNIYAGVDIYADRDIIAGRNFLIQGANLSTDAATFSLIDATATSVTAFSAADTIEIGATTGTLTINNEQVIFDSVKTIQIPVGTTLDRPTAATGQIRFNTDTTVFEGYDGIAWGSLGGVKDVDQNTFIRPETTPGANNNELEFYTDGSRRMIIGNTQFTIEATNPVEILNTSVSSDFTTGALTVAGGVGIGEELHVQKYIGGNTDGVLQLTNYASDKILIKSDTIESPEQIKWIANAPDSSADAIVYPITLAHHSVSGTIVSGSGTGLKFEMETSNDNFETGGQIDVIAQDVTGTQEDFDMVFSTMINGSVVEKLRLGENTSTFSTDVTINNDALLTTQTTFNLLNDTATTINFAGAATALNIGVTGGLTTIDQNVQVNEDVTIDGTLALTNIDLEVQYGGTGVSTFTTNGILYGNTADPVQVTDAAGTSDASVSFQILTVTSDVDATPVWTDTIDGGTF